MRRIRHAARGAMDVFTVLLVVSVLSIAGLVYVVVGLQGPPGESQEILYLQDGDKAVFDYVAYLDTGEVFATTIQSVARNDAAYPKSIIFRPEDFYAPMNATIGFPMLHAGFDGLADEGAAIQDGLLGMRMGETRTITFDADDAFGGRDPALMETRPLVESMPLKETIPATEYSERFFQAPIEAQTILDPLWDWPVRVLNYDLGSGLVTFRMEPTEGMVVSPYETFGTLVERVDTSANGGEGVVEVRHLISEADVGVTFGGGLKGGFLVAGLDTASGTFTADLNDFRAGRSITYVISLIEIQRT